LANIKSAKKRIEVNNKKQLRNKRVKSSTKTAVKKLQAAVAAGDKEKAAELHKLAVKAVDQAASKGVYHKNNASRKKSQLTKLVNTL